MADDGTLRELPLKETHFHESLLAYVMVEPAFLGNEHLLVIGRSIPTHVGDIVDLLVIDERDAVLLIFLPHGIAWAEVLRLTARL